MMEQKVTHFQRPKRENAAKFTLKFGENFTFYLHNRIVLDGDLKYWFYYQVL